MERNERESSSYFHRWILSNFFFHLLLNFIWIIWLFYGYFYFFKIDTPAHNNRIASAFEFISFHSSAIDQVLLIQSICDAFLLFIRHSYSFVSFILCLDDCVMCVSVYVCVCVCAMLSMRINGPNTTTIAWNIIWCEWVKDERFTFFCEIRWSVVCLRTDKESAARTQEKERERASY